MSRFGINQISMHTHACTHVNGQIICVSLGAYLCGVLQSIRLCLVRKPASRWTEDYLDFSSCWGWSMNKGWKLSQEIMVCFCLCSLEEIQASVVTLLAAAETPKGLDSSWARIFRIRMVPKWGFSYWSSFRYKNNFS